MSVVQSESSVIAEVGFSEESCEGWYVFVVKEKACHCDFWAVFCCHWAFRVIVYGWSLWLSAWVLSLLSCPF